jgi:hypothetical protein
LTHVFLSLPVKGNFVVFALAHRALVVVAQALLRPERTLALHVYFVRAEVRGALELLQNGVNLLVQVFQVLYRGARALQISLNLHDVV